jgi:chromosomal replication initiator protein
MLAWAEFLDSQENALGKAAVEKWLRPLKVVHFDSANLYLEAQDSFQLLWFEEHVRPLIKQSFVNNNSRPIKVHITCSEESKKTPGPKPKNRQQHSAIQFSEDLLDPHLILDQFVPGMDNALLFQFLKELVENPAALGSSNPILIYGGAGLGKTHLMMALTQAFRLAGLKSLYVRSETFTEHVVMAIRNFEMQSFRDHYRHADILLLDDVHLFAKRSATQEEFFHTFNALQMARKQIIITSHLPPSLLDGIEPRLISRLEWGIQFHLEKLNKAELKQALTKRSQSLGCDLEDQAIEFILEAFPSNLPSISRALNALILRSHLSGQPQEGSLSAAKVEALLKDLIEVENQEALSPSRIINSVAAYYGIRTEDILGKSHAHEFALPRQIAMHLCRKELRLPFMKIGEVFSRDHSTVMTSVKRIQQSLDHYDQEISSAIAEILRKLA